MSYKMLSGKDIQQIVKNAKRERQQVANRISWDRNSTPEEIKLYKQIKSMIVVGYTHDEIFKIAGRKLSSQDRRFIDRLLKESDQWL